MAMASNGLQHGITGINITPLIDVLLVLLIIFMVIVPATSHGLGANLPQPPKAGQPDAGDAIVVEIAAGPEDAPEYSINQAHFAKGEMVEQLTRIFVGRRDKVVFVKADPGMQYANVAEVVDMAHQANVDHVGLITAPGNRKR